MIVERQLSIYLSFTIDLIFLAPCRPMLEVLSLCRIQYRLSNIVRSTMINNIILCDRILFGVHTVTMVTAMIGEIPFQRTLLYRILLKMRAYSRSLSSMGKKECNTFRL